MLYIKYIKGHAYIYCRIWRDGKQYWIYVKKGVVMSIDDIIYLTRKIQKKVPPATIISRRSYDTTVFSSLYTALFFCAVRKHMLF